MKRLGTAVRYTNASELNARVSFIQPNTGQEADGTPNAPTVVRSNVPAKVTQWRGKETDKSESRVAISSYKMIIRYPKFHIDTGMQIRLRDQLHNIDSFFDPDGQRVELHIWTFVTDDTVN